MRDQVRAIAGLLEEKSAIPMVREQLQLIHDVQDEIWWQDVTVSTLEVLRLRLRLLVRLIDKRERKTLYTDFEDALGDETVVELPGVFNDSDFNRFRQKARHFLRAHQDNLTIHKLRTNKALTAADLAELGRMLAESGIGNADELKRAELEAQGLGLFVRILVGMDREAAKQALVLRSIKTFTFKPFENRSSSIGSAPDERSFRRCLGGFADAARPARRREYGAGSSAPSWRTRTQQG